MYKEIINQCSTASPAVTLTVRDSSGVFPDELILKIFSHLTLGELGRCALVNRKWNRLAGDDHLQNIHVRRECKQLEQAKRFVGPDTWKKYIGDVGEFPPPPENILEILNSPCPWTKGKKVKETHILGLIPAKVDDKPLTINLIGELVKSPKNGGNRTEYCHIWDQISTVYGNQASKASYWVLMTNRVFIVWSILGGGTSRSEQIDYVKSHKGYQVSKLIEAVFLNFMLKVSYGEKILDGVPWTRTCCEEQTVDGKLVVVGFPADLGIIVDRDYHTDYGFVAVQRFCGS